MLGWIAQLFHGFPFLREARGVAGCTGWVQLAPQHPGTRGECPARDGIGECEQGEGSCVDALKEQRLKEQRLKEQRPAGIAEGSLCQARNEGGNCPPSTGSCTVP